MVFCTFGAFFLSFAATLTPSFAAFATYAPAGEPAAAGLETQGFNASFGKSKDNLCFLAKRRKKV